MSIDKAIEHGKKQLEIFGGEHKEFIETSIATMRKYQKIQEIVEAWKADIDIDSYDSMADICEVVEDGNDDN